MHSGVDLAPISVTVLEAMRKVPRHFFIPDELQWGAYLNRPFPIGYGQTISQPYIVALMTSLINPSADDIVLEVGTGSGYQAAILSKLAQKVYSVELIDELSVQARERLHQLGFDNVEVRTGDGSLGWPEHAPYDAIIVTAAASQIPQALIEQLKPGGTLVMPVENLYSGQSLHVVKKSSTGQIEDTAVLPVTFVPLHSAGEEKH
ncbi:MAG: protein-L-isoaspartate(D-aspartate) O-methyltransferase [Alphaproteobacteria bacterium]|nr:protein-L-isoaspartate(D-aspartate) O-methyltransferase [Alphaproteobacteria bacterium]